MAQEAREDDYSLDMLKRAAFFYELSSLRIRYPTTESNNEIVPITSYLEKRLEEIDKKYKSK